MKRKINNIKILIVSTLVLLNCFANAQSRKLFSDSTFIIGDTIKVPELIFDLSFPLRTETIDSLEIVLNFMKRHPNFKIEIAIHTDSRGGFETNQRISEFRAKHVCNYLYSKLNEDNNCIECIGYGESQLLINNNEIEKAKTEEDREVLHKINRRTELIIKEIKNKRCI